jgi:hypothetical protein
MADLLQKGSQKLTRLMNAAFRCEEGRAVDAK